MEIQRGRNFRQIPNDKSITADVIVSIENKSPYVSNRPNFHLFSVLARLIVIRIRCRYARNPFGTHNACWCTIENRKLAICRQLSCSSLFSFFSGVVEERRKSECDHCSMKILSCFAIVSKYRCIACIGVNTIIPRKLMHFYCNVLENLQRRYWNFMLNTYDSFTIFLLCSSVILMERSFAVFSTFNKH